MRGVVKSERTYTWNISESECNSFIIVYDSFEESLRVNEHIHGISESECYSFIIVYDSFEESLRVNEHIHGISESECYSFINVYDSFVIVCVSFIIVYDLLYHQTKCSVILWF